jgi:chorismate dehydratase
VEIYLKKFVGIDPGFRRQKPVLEEMLQWHDAGLIIGDPALQAKTSGYYVYDLAEQWRNWTGRPFVFAFWAVRKAALAGISSDLNITQIFQQARDHGLEHIAEIADQWAPRLSLSRQLITEYLEENIDFTLDSDNLEGLRLFYRYGEEVGALPPAPELHFLEKTAISTQQSAFSR